MARKEEKLSGESARAIDRVSAINSLSGMESSSKG